MPYSVETHNLQKQMLLVERDLEALRQLTEKQERRIRVLEEELAGVQKLIRQMRGME
jgi:hypothetical protein